MQVVTLSSLLTTVSARHSRLLLELLGILGAAGFITASVEPPSTYRGTDQLGRKDLRAALGQLATHKANLENELVPDLATNVRLVWLCARALPDILTGASLQAPGILLQVMQVASTVTWLLQSTPSCACRQREGYRCDVPRRLARPGGAHL